MKNLLVLGLVAVCTVMIAGEQAFAKLGGGGGKVSTRARVIMTNTGVAGDIGVAAWVRPVGTPLPDTLGALRRQLIFIGPGETRQTAKLKNGAYLITTVDAADTEGPADTEIDEALVAGLVIGNQEFSINGSDRRANVNEFGIGFTN